MLARVLPLTLLPLVIAQVPLPRPPWLPPNASSGAVPTSGSIPNSEWSTLLGDLLYFYDAQRSGELPSDNRVAWRNDSALDDGKDASLDLTGGYYDAGDYVKFTLPLSWTLTSICWGALDFGSGYDMGNQTAYLDSMLRWGLDWLIKAHPSSHVLYVQVGDSNVDNAYWGPDTGIPEPRLSYQVNDTAPGTDTAASSSAAFSACSLLYNSSSNSTTSGLRPASLQNTTYAALLLSHATSLHDFAVNATGGQRTTQTSVPAVSDAYASSGYGDELTMSALFLAWATNSSAHYLAAEHFYSQYHLSGQDTVLNWDDRSPALPVLFAQVMKISSATALGANRTAGDWQKESEVYFDRIVQGKSQGYTTKGGLLWYNGVSDSASLNPALNTAMLMTRYASLASTDSKAQSYLTFAKSQLDYACGNNPMQSVYVVGVNPNSPANPHSSISSGGSDIGNINTSPMVEAYVLYGGVVGGPDSQDRFWDIRSDWVQGEVALDYNAPLLTLAAAHVMNDSADPFYTRLAAGAYAARKPKGQPCDASTNCDTNAAPKLPVVGQIVIGVVVTIVGLVVVGLSVCWGLLAVKNRRGSAGTAKSS